MRPIHAIPDRKQHAFKRGDVCYLRVENHYRECVFVCSHLPNYLAVTIKDGLGEITTSPDELITPQAYEAELFLHKQEEARKKYDWVIGYWNDGMKTNKAIAKKTGVSARAVGQVIAAAKRWKLIV